MPADSIPLGTIFFYWIAKGKNRVGNDFFRQPEQGALLLYTVHLRPCPQPHAANPKGVSGQNHILGRDCSVNDPVIRRGRERPVQIAADQNAQRRVFQRLGRIPICLCHLCQLLEVAQGGPLIPACKIVWISPFEMPWSMNARTLLRVRMA